MAAKFEGQLNGEPSLARCISEQLGCAGDALEHGVAMGVEPGRGAGRMLGLLEVDAQRLAQPRRVRAVLGKGAERGADELDRPAWIVCGQRGDFQFAVGRKSTAGRGCPAAGGAPSVRPRGWP